MLIQASKHPVVDNVASWIAPLLFVCLQLKTSPSGCTRRKERRWARWGLGGICLLSLSHWKSEALTRHNESLQLEMQCFLWALAVTKHLRGCTMMALCKQRENAADPVQWTNAIDTFFFLFVFLLPGEAQRHHSIWRVRGLVQGLQSQQVTTWCCNFF